MMESINKNLSYLTSLAKLLREAEDDKIEKEAGEDSLDSQIDKFFSGYEQEAKLSKNEGKDFRMFVRGFLTEAEDDEDDEDDKKDKSEKEEPEEPKRLTTEDIDVSSFVSSVVRLIDNYDSLLEVRNTILRRAVNFLKESYEQEVVDSFKEDLMENHGLEIGKSKSEVEDEEFQAPTADRAGSSPGGA